MSIRLTHAFSSGKADGSDSTLLQPSDWNAVHSLTVASARALGRITAGTGDIEELTAADLYTLLGWVAGTAVPFVQTAAPTGWTKQVTYDDALLRVVSGSASNGGSVGLSTLNAYTATDSFVLLSTHLPSHSHTFSGTTSTAAAHSHGSISITEPRTNHPGDSTGTTGGADDWADDGTVTTATGTNSAHTHTCTGTTGSAGSGGGHTHTLTFDVAYVDVIYATKD